MKQGMQKSQAVTYAVAMLMLILDAKTAFSGAKEAITLCLYTVIPSLFPFIFISVMLSSTLVGLYIPILHPLGKACGIPSGAESLLLLGLIGGYPIGAQNIAQAYRSGQLDMKDAHRLLGFCNNAGPAFIFGMMSSLFKSSIAPWLLWLIHIASAFLVGLILPNKSKTICSLSHQKTPTIANALTVSIKTMAEICGWIILFRIILSILQRWIFWILPDTASAILFGVTELTNGCIALIHCVPEGFKFIVSSAFLGFGGLCVAMQTVSVTRNLGTGLYFPGKILQTAISLVFASILQWFLYPVPDRVNISMLIPLTAVCIIVGLCYCLYRRKKVVEIPHAV